VSEDRSHGASVALFGEGTTSGPQFVVFSAADQAGGNEPPYGARLAAAIYPGEVPLPRARPSGPGARGGGARVCRGA